jgi:hypothetical protein
LSKFSQAQANVGFKIDVFYKWSDYGLFDYTLIRLQIYSTTSLQIVWLHIFWLQMIRLQIVWLQLFWLQIDLTTNYPTTNYPTTSWFDYKLTVKLIHNISIRSLYYKAFLA